MANESKLGETKCPCIQSGRNCPLDNRDVDPATFCEAYKQNDALLQKISTQ